MKPGEFIRLDRAELVELTKAVLGEVAAASSRGYEQMLQLYPRAGVLKLVFVLEGREVLGTYLVPIPGEVLDVVHDADRNPYNQVRVTITVHEGEVTSEPEREPEAPRAESPGDSAN